MIGLWVKQTAQGIPDKFFRQRLSQATNFDKPIANIN
jgi:hypothetical protein